MLFIKDAEHEESVACGGKKWVQYINDLDEIHHLR